MGISVCGLLCTSLFMLHLAAGDARPVRDDEPGLAKRPRKHADADADADADAGGGGSVGSGSGGKGGKVVSTHVSSKTAPKPKDGRKRKDGRDDLRYDRDRSNVGKVGTFHHVILQSKHRLMTARYGPCNQSDTGNDNPKRRRHPAAQGADIRSGGSAAAHSLTPPPGRNFISLLHNGVMHPFVNTLS
jgi:hypothetical protein